VPAAVGAGRPNVDSLVQEQPERVAQQLRAWISEDPE
jgi:flagellar biosynthesis/type III secretory pathway M-ring protein FliF/YscJ